MEEPIIPRYRLEGTAKKWVTWLVAIPQTVIIDRKETVARVYVGGGPKTGKLHASGADRLAEAAVTFQSLLELTAARRLERVGCWNRRRTAGRGCR